MSFVTNENCCSDAHALCANCERQSREETHRLLSYYGFIANGANDRGIPVPRPVQSGFDPNAGFGEASGFRRLSAAEQARGVGVDDRFDDDADGEADSDLLTAPTLSDLLKGEQEAKASFDDVVDTGDMFTQGKSIRRMPKTGGLRAANSIHNELTTNGVCTDNGLEIPVLKFEAPRKWRAAN